MGRRNFRRRRNQPRRASKVMEDEDVEQQRGVRSAAAEGTDAGRGERGTGGRASPRMREQKAKRADLMPLPAAAGLRTSQSHHCGRHNHLTC